MSLDNKRQEKTSDSRPLLGGPRDRLVDYKLDNPEEVAAGQVFLPETGKSAKSGSRKDEQKQADIVIQLASDAELFHDPDGAPYATFEVNEHIETWPMRSRTFKGFLLKRFFEETGSAPNAQAMRDALGVLESRALFDGAEIEVFVRLAELDGAIYLDLANDSWEAVEITAEGWNVVTDPLVKFRRTRGMRLLPRPERGGSLLDLRPFVNVGSDSDWVLLVAWLVAALRPWGPYPVLVIHGEQGSAKSTLARVLRMLLDPNSAPLRSEPRDG